MTRKGDVQSKKHLGMQTSEGQRMTGGGDPGVNGSRRIRGRGRSAKAQPGKQATHRIQAMTQPFIKC